MAMPKTAMNKYDLPGCWENQIWSAWKIPFVEAKSVSESMDKPADTKFWLRVLALNAPHQRGSLLHRHNIHARSCSVMRPNLEPLT
jgi:hypothetical protein